jgi:hypothetical protein
MNKEIERKEVVNILEHGFRILAINKLKCFPGTLYIAETINADTYGVIPYDIECNEKLKWSDFVLIFNGKKYYSKFKNLDEWMLFYKNF